MTANTKVANLTQDGQARRKVSFNLRAPGLLARWPVIGILMFVFGSLVFAGLTINLVAHGPLLAWDQALATSLPAIGLKSPPFVEVLMRTGFYMGKEVIMVADILLAIYFIYKKFWQEFAMVTVGWLGAALLFYGLSTFLARARPLTQIWIVVNIPGFPSGHAISVITFYGLLAYLIAPKMRSTFGKLVVVAAALAFIVFVGFSRVFTGGHYLTDILSGYAVGIAWCGFIYTAIEVYAQKRKNQNVKKE